MGQTTDLNKPQKIITDNDIQKGQYVKFSKDTVYILQGYVFAEENSVLEIEPGTVVKMKNTMYFGTLVIMQDAKIIAEGTKEEPIIITSATNFLSDGTGYWNALKIGEKRAMYGGHND